MKPTSAGILLYRHKEGNIQFFLVHPGGPFFAKKDIGVWSVPKGEFTSEEDPLAAAKREFYEETGIAINGEFRELKPVRQKSGKMVYVWAVEGNLDETQLKSNLFEMEWPPRSGKTKTFPEIDKGAWFNTETALVKIIPAQVPLIEGLLSLLDAG